MQREFVRDLFYAANTTYNERSERLTLEEEIKINEVCFMIRQHLPERQTVLCTEI